VGTLFCSPDLEHSYHECSADNPRLLKFHVHKVDPEDSSRNMGTQTPQRFYRISIDIRNWDRHLYRVRLACRNPLRWAWLKVGIRDLERRPRDGRLKAFGVMNPRYAMPPDLVIVPADASERMGTEVTVIQFAAMDLLQLAIQQRDRLDQVIKLLRGTPAITPTSKPASASRTKAKGHKWTAAQREAMSVHQKKIWANRKKRQKKG
jgi:hypothetical protein